MANITPVSGKGCKKAQKGILGCRGQSVAYDEAQEHCALILCGTHQSWRAICMLWGI